MTQENQQCGCRTSPTQTELYKDSRWLEAGNFGFRKCRNCTVHEPKTKALVSFTVSVKLILAFVFAYAKCSFLMMRLKYLSGRYEHQQENRTSGSVDQPAKLQYLIRIIFSPETKSHKPLS